MPERKAGWCLNSGAQVKSFQVSSSCLISNVSILHLPVKFLGGGLYGHINPHGNLMEEAYYYPLSRRRWWRHAKLKSLAPTGTAGIWGWSVQPQS